MLQWLTGNFWLPIFNISLPVYKTLSGNVVSISYGALICFIVGLPLCISMVKFMIGRS